MGRQLIVLGLVIAAIGAVMALGVPLGRLPGDFTYRRDSFSFYFPLTTSILISIVFTLIAMFWGRR
jgi:formate hydrogenlyase subunit 3/multisubunit Na+/H+ antiporter MnhD subunit